MYLLLAIFILQIVSIIIKALYITYFTKSFVKSGIVVFKEDILLDTSLKFPENDITIKKKVGNFLISNDQNIYVYPKMFWSGWYHTRTKYSLRLLVSPLDENLKIKGKISIITIVSDFIILIILLSLIYLFIEKNDITVAVIVSLFALFMLFVSFIQPYFAIKDNYNFMIKELKDILAKEEFKI